MIRATFVILCLALVAAAPAAAHVGVKSYSPKRGGKVSFGEARSSAAGAPSARACAAASRRARTGPR